jgi:hypothetical protein
MDETLGVYAKGYDFGEPHAYIRGDIGHSIATLRTLGSKGDESAARARDLAFLKHSVDTAQTLLEHRLTLSREYSEQLGKPDGFGWVADWQPATARTDSLRSGAVLYQLPVGGKLPSLARTRSPDWLGSVQAFRLRAFFQLATRIEVDERLLAQLGRLRAVLGEHDAGRATDKQVIAEGAALLRLEAKLTRDFTRGTERE